MPKKKGKTPIEKIVLLVIIIFFTFFVVMGAFAGLFADGGTVFERIFLILLNPLGTVAVYIGLLSKKLSKSQKQIIMTLLLVNIVIAAWIAISIILGIEKGSWWIPILLVFPQLLYALYLTMKK